MTSPSDCPSTELDLWDESQLAAPYSVKIVADLVGLPDAGREHLIARASAAFNTFGPDNELLNCSR